MKNQKEINKNIAEKNTEIMKMMKEIECALCNPCSDDNDWGHVGSTEHVKNEIEDIRNFICNKSA